MDFQLKQWNTDLNSPKETQSEKLKNRHHQSYLPPAKIPKFLHDQSEVDTAAETETETAAFKSNDHNDQGTKTTTAALPLFVAEVEELNPSSSSSSKLTTTTNFPGSATCYSDSTSRFGYGDGGVGSVVVGGGYFSLAQWQELELQAVIYRHMAAGATVPPELLQLVKRSLIANSPSLYLRNYTYYHQQPQPPPLMQTGMMGYWGSKGSAMDAEPGRCRRTDGKKWRCSRDVVVGQKYCERHVHRGRNRSRKPVEFPPPPSPLSTASTVTDPVGFASDVIDGGGGGLFRVSSGFAGGGEACFSLSGSVSGSFNGAGQLNKRKFLSENEPTAGLSDAKKSSNGQVLRHFFDDWPGSTTHNDTNHAPPPGTCLSISTPGLNPSSSSSLDFLKLSTGTGGGDDRRVVEQQQSQMQRQQQQLMMSQQQVNWNRMGGPLGEALRSSTTVSGSGSSPTSVLHHPPQQLPRSVSETSYVSA